MMVLVNNQDCSAVMAAAAALLLTSSCEAQGTQARPDLYACEGCEAVAERPAPELRSDVDVARGEPGQPLILEGRVFQPDGKTPAPGIVIYLHQTNANGLYANGMAESEWSRRHGRLRSWARTDRRGRYRFRTIKPAPYPDRTMPAHIHLYIGEAGRRPYYVDDVVFEGEFKVDDAYLARQELRGGSGVVRPTCSPDGSCVAVRDIRLEPHPD